MMAKKSGFNAYWAKLIGQAQVRLMGSSKAQLKVQLFDVLDNFFNVSCCWTEAIRFIVIPETLDYPLQPVEGGRIVRLDSVINQFNVPEQAFMPDIGTVKFRFPFNQPQPMVANVIKTVTDPLACYPPNIPEWVLPTYSLTILHGLLGSMMLVPAQSYSNPQQAQFHLQKYHDGVGGACVAATKANTVGVQNWTFPQSFRTSSQRGGISTYNVIPIAR
jgi:hypothetical protein